MVEIRELDAAADAEAVYRLFTAAFPFLVQGPAVLRHRVATAVPEQHRIDLVAEHDGTVIGYASSTRDEHAAHLTRAQLIVAPANRRRGVGSALFDRLRRHWHAHADEVAVRLTDDAALKFASDRGFSVSRTERISRLRLTELQPAHPVADGFVLRRASQLDDLRPLHEIDSAAMVDVPGDSPLEPMHFEQWHDYYANDPRTDLDLIVIAFDASLPVSVAWLERAGSRVWSGFTGTRRRYRGKGLALAAKSEALTIARDRGVYDAYTNNDATNAAMLAVNTRLGYRRYVEQHLLQRHGPW